MPVDNNNNHDRVIERHERKLKARDKRKRSKMKVSGGSVKKLQKVISRKP